MGICQRILCRCWPTLTYIQREMDYTIARYRGRDSMSKVGGLAFNSELQNYSKLQ